MKPSRRLPSPSLIVSIVAVALALAGTAIAGQATISALSGGEKKKVKEIARTIADERITAQAGGLTVKRAQSAATADIAQSAATADIAQSAGTAEIANAVAGEYFAVVNGGDGSLNRGTANVSSVRLNTGQYDVSIDRNVAQCFFTATIGGTAAATLNGEISAVPELVGANKVLVVTRDSAGGLSDRTFTLHIRC